MTDYHPLGGESADTLRRALQGWTPIECTCTDVTHPPFIVRAFPVQAADLGNALEVQLMLIRIQRMASGAYQWRMDTPGGDDPWGFAASEDKAKQAVDLLVEGIRMEVQQP